MAGESQLADFYVQFSSRDSKKLDREIDSKRGRLMAAAAAAGSFAKQAAGGFASAAQSAARFAAVASVAGTAFVLRGMQGTREAEALSSSFLLLSRIVADVFAPVIRGVTQGIIELSRWWLSLDKDTRNSVQNWALLGAAVIAAAAAFPLVTKAISLVGTALSLLATKAGLIIASVAGIAVALAYAAGEGDSFAERVLVGFSRIFVGAKALGAGVSAYFKSIWKDIADDFEYSFSFGASGRRVKVLDSIRDAEKAADNAFNNVMANQFNQAEQKARDMGKAINDIPALIGNALAGLFGGEEWKRIKDAFGDRRPLQVIHKVDVLSLDAVWQKMQQSQESNEQKKQVQELEQIRRDMSWLREHGIRIINPPPAWV